MGECCPTTGGQWLSCCCNKGPHYSCPPPEQFPTPAPHNGEPVYDGIDLEATYNEITKVFQRMNLGPRDMAALIGAGHGAGAASLEGGAYHGQWVPPQFPMGSQFFKFLNNHAGGWCAVKSSDTGSALFVAGGPKGVPPAKEYSPMPDSPFCSNSTTEGTLCCKDPSKQVGRPDYVDLPTIDYNSIVTVHGAKNGDAGAAAMMPCDFMLQYGTDTYAYVQQWHNNSALFYSQFSNAWNMLTTNGVSLLCPDINLPFQPSLSSECKARFGNDTQYYTLWRSLKQDLSNTVSEHHEKCISDRSFHCATTFFRLGWHISGTFDPSPVPGTDAYAGGRTGGSDASCIYKACSNADGCGGCLCSTVLTIQQFQQEMLDKYPSLNPSQADLVILAAGIAGELLSLNNVNLEFQPGRRDVDLSVAECHQLGSRLPAPAYFTSMSRDRRALIKLYDATQGPRWLRSDGWDTAASPCEWHGVTCADAPTRGATPDLVRRRGPAAGPREVRGGRRVVGLSLPANRLDGPADAVRGLTALTRLDLSGNPLSGSGAAALPDFAR